MGSSRTITEGAERSPHGSHSSSMGAELYSLGMVTSLRERHGAASGELRECWDNALSHRVQVVPRGARSCSFQFWTLCDSMMSCSPCPLAPSSPAEADLSTQHKPDPKSVFICTRTKLPSAVHMGRNGAKSLSCKPFLHKSCSSVLRGESDTWDTFIPSMAATLTWAWEAGRHQARDSTDPPFRVLKNTTSHPKTLQICLTRIEMDHKRTQKKVPFHQSTLKREQNHLLCKTCTSVRISARQ